MRKLLAAAALALLFPLSADAQISFGASLGYAFPMGEAEKDVDMSDGISGAIPIELSARYAVIPNLDLGLYGGYAFGLVGGDFKDACDAADADCAARVWRLGLLGEYGFGDMGGFVPFVGASFGWEWASQTLEVSSYEYKAGSSGWEAGLKGGADMKLGEKAKVGAFIGLSFGTYGKWWVDDDGTETDGDIEDTAMHEWLTIGVRGTFGL